MGGAAEFEAHVSVPVKGTKLHTWQMSQMSGCAGLGYKIEKGTELNDGGTWSDRKARLKSCIAQKNHGMHNIKWDEQYIEFEAHVGVPAVGTTLYNWKKHQMSNGSAGLDAKIEKESEANEGGNVWSDRKVRLESCIAQKIISCTTTRGRSSAQFSKLMWICLR